ncbi:ABC transporter permease [Xanthocytophaga agilis]|uniref:ABC transporter permease n=1 Tax=Xanthocytophaga agilis TaxID=3048010 RepID=A0AAE3R0P6_9BACT|nr:ABC transporter permease [Xanthocytophaga agilis]MDJ1499549.1 ABC transporter permease [Xanthocytophaga agilis]
MLKNYLKTTWRNLIRHKLFSTINIAGLGIGFAAVWLMVLFVADELSFDQYHTKADRIYRVVHYAQWPGGNLKLAPTSAPFAEALKREYPEIEQTVRIVPEGGGIIHLGEKQLEVNDIYFADPSVFDIFSISFLYGNPKTALTHDKSIVITRSLAEKLFGDASKALNQPIQFSNNFENLVTGVIEDIPANSHLQFSALRSLSTNWTDGWQNFSLYTYILLKPNANVQTLESKLSGFYPKYLKGEMGTLDYRMELQPLTSIHLHSHLDYEAGPNGDITTIYIFILVTVLILVIACINYINLYTARSSTRVREVGVRKAIGSPRAQLVQQFLLESNLFTGIAAIIGFVLANIALPYFNQLADKTLILSQFGVATTIGIFILFSLLVGVVSGIYPALLLSNFHPVSALKNQVSKIGKGSSLRKTLVVFQFTTTVIMIVGSLVIYLQLQYTSTKNLGFNKDQVTTFHIDNEEVRTQVSALKQQLLQSPLIESVASASNPIGNNNIGTNGIFFEQNGEMPTSTQVVQKFLVDSDFLHTLEIKLLKGRNFSPDIISDRMEAVLVNEALVKKMGWQEPIGKRVKYFIDNQGNTQDAKVIGVVKDFHIYSLQHKIEPLVLQMPPPSERDNIYLRIQPDKTQQALAFIEKTFHAFDPSARLNFHFLDDNFSKQYQTEQKQGEVLFVFTILSILIACLGLLGLAAFTAEQRIKEIGIRKVLGASVLSIVTLLSTDFLKLVVIAIVIATPIAWYAIQQWLQNFAYHFAVSGWLFLISGFVVISIALLTVSILAIKAARENPVKSLRSE